MSAIRSWSVFTRRDRRQKSAKPYSYRPVASIPQQDHPDTQKKDEATGWGLSGIFSFISSLGAPRTSKDELDRTMEEGFINDTDGLVDNSSLEGDAPTSTSTTNQPIASGSRLPPRTSTNFLMDTNDETILEWLKHKQVTGGSISGTEVARFQALIKKRREKTYEPESFHFSGAPPTPAHSPVNDVGSPSPAPLPRRYSTFSGASSLPHLTNNTPLAKPSRRMLKQDPNGPLRWNGAGRARTTPAQSRRNTPARASTQHSSKAGNLKRRRVFEEKDDSSTPPGMTASQSTPVFSSGSAGAGPSTPRKLSAVHQLPRASIIRPPTYPAVPSPLRQVVNGASLPSSPSSSPSNQRTSPTSAGVAQTCTRAASVLTEIIEKNTPPPKPDIANPYQTACPVRPMARPKERKRLPERKAKDAEKEKEGEKELSAKTIIESTVPKGAKRSRPPPGLGKSKGADVDASVNGKIEESEGPSPKKKFRTVTIEEVDDDDNVINSTSYTKPAEVIELAEPSSGIIRPSTSAPNNLFASPSNIKTSVFGVGKSSLPKEPSKLRSSFIAEEEESELAKPVAPVPGKTAPSSLSGQSQNTKGPKEVAMEVDETMLPIYTFKLPEIILNHAEARAYASALPVSALPAFDFSKPSTIGTAAATAVSKPASPANPVAPPAAPVVRAFDWAAAGIVKAKSSGDQWMCGTCMLSNPASAKEKCTICLAPR